MTKLSLILLLSGIFMCCTSDDNSSSDTELIGTWVLIEILSDPGDGSGVFQSVKSEKTVKFNADGTLQANGELCVLTTDSDLTVAGTYSKSDLTINTPNCSTLRFKQMNNELIISIPCDEPCRTKYRKQ